ncbi:YopX family protein [Enterococcus faecalis]|uniref:YopX family protein n=1 Tax=Enterococcus faecalis TaxID=1351 RepID=UPI0011D2338E|nr:YopX family protein [Enterococcus faecalis]KAF2506307.1 hypothetical protein JAOMBFPH_13815 [Enterococcus faecalis]
MIPKFRAWDKRSKEMWKVSTLHIEDEYVDLFKKNIYENPLNDPWAKFGDAILMQATGLKDKNGVEIFEGDLVEHDDNINGTWETFEACEIVYDVDYAQFCFKNDASNFLSYYRNLCIIGNIHENPELLEESE